VLATFLAVPFLLLLGAHLWQLLPHGVALRLQGWPRLATIGVAIPLGFLLGRPLGAWIESAAFDGDLFTWLTDRSFGTAFGGWAVMLLPIGVLVSTLVVVRVVGPRLRAVSAGWTRGECALADLGKWLAGCAFAVAVSCALAWFVASLGADPRGPLVDTYIQKNALVVGFVMGFAVIPILYTLAEDSLSSVPNHLREASLGAGATQWQTAMRVVVPTAMSGLFSALMIGLGRAVGETMIVLMAAGNTPLMEWNPFNGLRTLSANLAVELPEAPQDSTHYRVLFLAALCLFAMTFVLNTLAEVVRQRFRKRSGGL
jgi:phosphate transport system permease protein